MIIFLSAKAGKYKLIWSLLNNLKGAFWISRLSPSIHKFDYVYIYSIRPESFDLEALDRLMAGAGLSAARGEFGRVE